MGARHDMAAKLTFGFLLKSTEEMSEEDMPHDGSEALFGSDEAGTASQLYRRHPLLAETRRNIRQMTRRYEHYLYLFFTYRTLKYKIDGYFY